MSVELQIRRADWRCSVVAPTSLTQEQTNVATIWREYSRLFDRSRQNINRGGAVSAAATDDLFLPFTATHASTERNTI